ncbi:MAG: selenocysteine-specific translation elongation factor [Actinomycetota bacterium]|nr:selenocysteine-specific translation elongation factor [Actinomycetota bacterium]
MPIIATAGHVDHGKSTLVEALTGRDPDRWAEEKARGLTIDLGFAWARIGDHDVGFVDVPGHERFIKNMLAGVGALDVALFVVAADEGWMPQSEEHLAVLDLLDSSHGVIALTRVDLTDDDTVDLAEIGILEAVEGTSLEGWPIIRVSPITGTGMDSLRIALDEQLTTAGNPPDQARPRLWIDRSFSIRGAGLVVTGTLIGGTLTEGDELMLWPGSVPVRVRGLQRHDTPATTLQPGNRAAVNLAGIDEVGRGAMLGRSIHFGTSRAFLARIRQVRNTDQELSSRGAFHLHVGSGSWPARIRIIAADAPDIVCLVRISDEIPLHSGDRFILREVGRRAVVAGGTVLDPHPPQHGSRLRNAIPILLESEGGGPDEAANALLTIRRSDAIARLSRDSGGGTAASIFRAGDLVMAEDAAADLLVAAASLVAAFHKDNRLRPGIPKATLGSSLGVGAEAINMLVSGAGDLIDDGATVRLASFQPGLTNAEQQAWDTAGDALRTSLAVPRASALGLSTELLHALVRDNRLVRVGDDLVYLPEQIDAITGMLRRLEDGFTVAEFRDQIGVTRRQAVPLLEWFDKQGTTVRRGDGRVARKPES